MDKQDILRHWDAARLNREKLAGCARHRFTVTSIMARHNVCHVCEGRMDTGQVYAYADGYVAAGGALSDVLTENLPNG